MVKMKHPNGEKTGVGQRVIVTRLSPTIFATITSFIQNGDDFSIKLGDMEGKDADETATIKLPASGTSPLDSTRWWNALAAVWGEAREHTADGAQVSAKEFEGKRVRVMRLKATCADSVYTGWDFEPQASFDVKAKMTMTKVAGKVRRFFGGKR